MAEVVGSSPIGSTMIYNQSMALVDPKETIQSKEVQELVKFFNETLGFCPNSVLTMQRKPGLAEASAKPGFLCIVRTELGQNPKVSLKNFTNS